MTKLLGGLAVAMVMAMSGCGDDSGLVTCKPETSPPIKCEPVCEYWGDLPQGDPCTIKPGQAVDELGHDVGGAGCDGHEISGTLGCCIFAEGRGQFVECVAQ